MRATTDPNDTGTGARGETPSIRVSLFGGPRIEMRGADVPLSPLQGALVGLVFGSDPRGLERARIAECLWGTDVGSSQAHRRFAQLLYSLHKRLGGARLCTVRGDFVWTLPEAVRSDLEDWIDSLKKGSVEEAERVLNEGFLRFLRPPTDEMADWVTARELFLRSELRRAAIRAWDEAEAGMRLDVARAAAGVLSRVDPGDEETLRRVLWSWAVSGRVAEAKAAYAKFEDERSASGPDPWQPAEPTRDLIRRIEDLAEATAPLRSGAGPTDPLIDPPLVGRDDPLGLLRDGMGSEPDGAIPLFVIAGEAGTGKTRLVEEAIPAALVSGARVLRGSATVLGQGVPLSPLIEALREGNAGAAADELEAPWRNVLLGLMPEFHGGEGAPPPIPPVQPGSMSHRLFEAVRRLLYRLAEPTPLVLFFDDFQWADDTTVSAISFLLRRWTEGRLTIVLGVRSEMVDREGGVQALLTEALLREETERIVLGELEQADAMRLARSMAGDGMGDPELFELCESSGRVPFFLVELVADRLRRTSEGEPPGASDPPLPLSVSHVLESRFRTLDPVAEQVMGLLAVHGRPVSLFDLARMARGRPDLVVRAADQLEELRLAQSSEGAVMVRHGIIAQAMVARLTSVRRSHHHGRVARHLIRKGEADHLDELAIHFDQAREPELALRYALRAANRAEEVGAIAEAVKVLHVARRNAHAKEDVTRVVGALSRLHYLSQDFAAAAPVLDIAAKRFREAGDEAAALLAEVRRVDSLGQTSAIPVEDCLAELERLREEAGRGGYGRVVGVADDVALHVFHRTSNTAGATRLVSSARDPGPESPLDVRIEALLLLSANLYYGEPPIAVEAVRTAIHLLDGIEDRNQAAEVLNRALMVHARLGTLHLPEGMAVRNRSVEAARQTGDLLLRYSLIANIGVYEIDRRKFAEARDLLATAAKAVAGSAARLPRILDAMNLGEVALGEGEHAEAERRFREALRLESEGGGHPLYRGVATAGLGLSLLTLGELGEARQTLSKLSEPVTPWRHDATLQLSFLARMLTARGDHPTVLGMLRVHAEHLEPRFPLLWLKVAAELVRASMAAGRGSDARSWASAIVERCQEADYGSHEARARGWLDRHPTA